MLSAALDSSTSAVAQVQGRTVRSRIVAAIDDSAVVRLPGNTHPLARPEFDLGELPDAAPLHRMILVLRRSDEQETELKRLIDSQQDRNAASFHGWLTPESFGAQFGPSDADLRQVQDWLAKEGFTRVTVNAGRTVVEFDGTAGGVRAAFHTTMHRYRVAGEERIGNASDPGIPAALMPVVMGVASLNSFPKRAANHKAGEFRRNNQTGEVVRRGLDMPASNAARDSALSGIAQPEFTFPGKNSTFYGVTPSDFASIYNVLPLWTAATPVDGTGQVIAIVGQTDINPADFVAFRRLFGLALGDTSGPTGTQYLKIINNGPNPGVTPDEGEADIDTQWSSAVAKNATIDYVTSEGTEVTQGTDLSALYIVENNLAPVMSYSYGGCELSIGTAGNAFFTGLWQQAAAQGITVMVSSGDSGSAVCDFAGAPAATNGLAVNGLASTPYNVAVGGTDFYMPQGGSAYWNQGNDPVTQASAKGYIPESTWNDSCTNQVLGLAGTFIGQTSEQICNSGNALQNGLVTVVGGSGGPSSCVRSNGRSVASCVGGTPKPAWQTGPGVPADGVRDLPDVSLFASNGFFGAFYVVCQKSGNRDGAPCSVASPYTDFAGYGGTSVAAPAFAGLMSLVNQKTGARQGNANYVLYKLAAQQAQAATGCDATGNPSAACTFHDVTTGTIAMPCAAGSPNCTVLNAVDHVGVLSGWTTTAGYDLAAGLGSVNAANLVNHWTDATFRSTSTTLTLSPSTVVHGSAVVATMMVTSATGVPSGDISVNGAAPNGAVGFGTLAGGAYHTPVKTFPGGSYAVQAHYAGDGTFAGSDSNPVALTVTPEGSTTTLRALRFDPATGHITTVSSTPYGSIFLLRTDVAGLSGQGFATGKVTLTDNNAAYDGGTFKLNSAGYTEDQTDAIAPGSHLFSAGYEGDASFNASASAAVALLVTKGVTTVSLTSSGTSIQPGDSVMLTATVLTTSYGHAGPGSVVVFKVGGVTVGSGALAGSVDGVTGVNVGTATLQLAGSALLAGANQVTAEYAGDGNYLGAVSPAVTLTTGTGPAGFTFGTSAAAASVTRGSSSQAVTLTLTPSGGFNAAVAFTCSGLPLGATCVFLPASVTPGTGSATTALSFTAMASGGRAGLGQGTPGAGWTYVGGGTLCGVWMLAFARRRRRWSALSAIFGMVLLAAMSGCGSGVTALVNPGTPTGSYAIVMTAAGGGVSQATTLTLTVQ